MKMRELCEKTNISKRNVHFYIKEGLIEPAQDPENGYYEFSGEDCSRLAAIRSLRDAGFSISQIRSLLQAPSTAVYYLNQRLKQLHQESSRLRQLEQSLSYMQQNLPLHPGLSDLAQLIRNASVPPVPEQAAGEEALEEYDSALVNRYLWETFLPDTPLTEYQEFLWSKINHYTAGLYEEDYQKISKALHGFTEEQIREYFSGNRQIHAEVIDLDEGGYAAYAENMKTAIRQFLDSPLAVRRWKNLYQTLLAPSTRLYDSEMAKTMEELSPLFASYRTNINAVCNLVYDWLHTTEGALLYGRMTAELGEYLNIDSCRHGQLPAMAFMKEVGS